MTDRSNVHYWLRVAGPDGSPWTVPLAHADVSIGRDRMSTVVLDHGLVSRHHARVHFDPSGGWVVTDLVSANGTRLNGQPLATPSWLRLGDVVGIGPFDLRLLDSVEQGSATVIGVVPPEPLMVDQPQAAVPEPPMVQLPQASVPEPGTAPGASTPQLVFLAVLSCVVTVAVLLGILTLLTG